MLGPSTTEHENGGSSSCPPWQGNRSFEKASPRLLRQGGPTTCLPGTHTGAPRPLSLRATLPTERIFLGGRYDECFLSQ
jgi:hypothetical protein